MLAIFRTDASHGLTDPHVVECIKAVESWSNGTFRMTPPEDPFDIPVVPFDVYPPGKDTLVPSSVNLHEDKSESDNPSVAPHSHLSIKDAKSEADNGASIVTVDAEYQGRPVRRCGYPVTPEQIITST